MLRRPQHAPHADHTVRPLRVERHLRVVEATAARGGCRRPAVESCHSRRPAAAEGRQQEEERGEGEQAVGPDTSRLLERREQGEGGLSGHPARVQEQQRRSARPHGVHTGRPQVHGRVRGESRPRGLQVPAGRAAQGQVRPAQLLPDDVHALPEAAVRHRRAALQDGAQLRDAGPGDAGDAAQHLRQARAAAEEVLADDVLDAQVRQSEPLAVRPAGAQGPAGARPAGDEQDGQRGRAEHDHGLRDQGRGGRDRGHVDRVCDERLAGGTAANAPSGHSDLRRGAVYGLGRGPVYRLFCSEGSAQRKAEC